VTKLPRVCAKAVSSVLDHGLAHRPLLVPIIDRLAIIL